MRTADILQAWKSILQGRPPSLSIEITRECPLRCPGCYAYDADHLGEGLSLRDVSDFKGNDLVQGILDIVDRERPLHLSLVGGDPLVRYRELEEVVPQLLARGIHVQIVTSAFRPLPAAWRHLDRLSIAVSIDGLAPEHDVRRKPATYERILKNIAGHRIIVHCTITAQMMSRPGYLDEFLAFWDGREEVAKIWFSMFTPQRGADAPEILSQSQREQAVRELLVLGRKYPKADLPETILKQFLRPPSSPDDCIFAKTTRTISADLTTSITPCQFGGDPDCAQCGCYASMGLASIGDYKLGGLIPVGAIFHASFAIGNLLASPPPAPEPIPELISISTKATSYTPGDPVNQ